ncbi:MAG TPA: peptidoglycan DD-metalloendopeptidase family protein [Vicinamibacteria bacterium]|nr:peptidoglycan DD-metalloendopeptidase family protein [Vicinamibacteria bacterium]
MKIGRLAVLVLSGLAAALAQEPKAAKNPDSRLSAEENKLELLNGRLADLRREVASLDRKETSLLGELHRLDLEIRVAGDELELLRLSLDRGYRAMDENLRRIEALEKSIDELKPYLSSRTESLYKLGRLSYVRLLLSVEKPSELTRAYRYISRLAREDTEKMKLFLDDQNRLKEAKAELVVQTEQMLAMRKDLEATSRTLESRRANRKALLSEVYARQEMAGSLVHELEGAREELGKLVESLVTGEAGPHETVDLPMRLFEGELGWPVEGPLAARFGRELHPRFKTVTVRNGIDIEAPAGTGVSAIYEGKVVFASWFQGYGKLLIVQHPGNVHSLYGYLSEFNVQVGDRVVRGDPVAWVGDTGSLEGPRLYFEIRAEGRPEDPEKWLTVSRRLAARPSPN